METKKTYKTPLVERVKLDNEISLALASLPPTYESNAVKPTNPFKTETNLV